MFQKKSWLFLCVAFALLAVALFLPFERISCAREGTLVTGLSGYTLIGGSGVIAVEGDLTAPVKRLTDEAGAARADYSYVYSLMLVAAFVGIGGALLDRRGRRKGVIGVVCSAVTFGLSLFMVFHVSRNYLLSARLAESIPNCADFRLTAAPGVGFTVMMLLSAWALSLSIVSLVLTPKGEAETGLGHTRVVTRVGVLAAIAAVLYYIPGIPVIPPIYKLDFSSVPVLLGGFSMGPLPGLCVLLVKDAVGLTHSSSMGVGELADFMTTAAMMLAAVAFYRRHRTLRGALTGLLLGVAAIVAVGAVANYFIMIPFYVNVMHMPLETILSMIAQIIPPVDSLPKLILLATVPFNLLKGVALALITFLLYKRLSPILK